MATLSLAQILIFIVSVLAITVVFQWNVNRDLRKYIKYLEEKINKLMKL